MWIKLLTYLCPQGFVIVPKEPTDKQISAGLQAALELMDQNKIDALSPFEDYPPPKQTTAICYTAMIKAA